jgi:uncharacterized protein YbbK (DUF523 family)
MASLQSKRPLKSSSPKFIVSACLAGINCTYNGKNKLRHGIRKLVLEGSAIPVCPEVFGGSPIPREACEISSGDGERVLAKKAKVRTVSGKDVTPALISGARKTLLLAKRLGIKKAILKSKSPSCGRGVIYDGTFTGILKKGNGVTTELLLKYNIKIYNEKDAKLWPVKSTI